MAFASLALLAVVLTVLLRAHPALAGLTAQHALRWAIVATVVAMLAVTLELLPGIAPRNASMARYFAATMLLTPLVDLLGARKPGHRAWPWFVVVPLVVVLQWPAVSQVFSERSDIPTSIPAPTCLGFLFVLMMGAGNFFGTAHTTACLTGAAGVVLFVWPVTEWSSWPGEYQTLLACGGLSAAAVLAFRRLRTLSTTAEPGQLWTDFRDIYGLVWSKRVMDRVNQFAVREDWSVFLTLDGFEPRQRQGTTDVATERPDAGLRWVLRRFADERFLDRYPIENQPVSASATSVR